MVGQPRHAATDSRPCTAPPGPSRQLHHRAQQRMTRRDQPRRRHIPSARPGPQPEPLALERIRRQAHPPRHRRTRTPSPPAARGQTAADSGGQPPAACRRAAAPAPATTPRHRQALAARRRPAPCRGPTSQDAGTPCARQRQHGIAEPHGLSHVPHPVPRARTSAPRPSPRRSPWRRPGCRGARSDLSSATAPNSASIGSISGEWNAWLTRSRRVRTSACGQPRAASSATTGLARRRRPPRPGR